MTTDTPTTPITRDAREPDSAPRCPECGIAQNTGDFARIPRPVRRLPALAVAFILIVMLAFIFIPRLTAPLGDWYPSWSINRWPDGWPSNRVFVGQGFRIADLRALLAPEVPSSRSDGDLARALLEALRKQSEVGPSVQAVISTYPPHVSLEETRTRGWPVAWQMNKSAVRYSDWLNRTGLLADPDYPQQNPPTQSTSTLARVSRLWTQIDNSGRNLGYWIQTFYPLALLAPFMLAVFVFETVRFLARRFSAHGSRTIPPAHRRRSSTKLAACAAIAAFLALSIAMLTARHATSTPTPTSETTSNRSEPLTLLALPIPDFKQLCTSQDADRILAQRLLSAIEPDVRDDDALFLGTRSTQSTLYRTLVCSRNSSFAGESLLRISTQQKITADGTPFPSRGKRLKINPLRDENVLEVDFRMPSDPTTRATATIGLIPLLFWSTLAAAAMYTARLTRHLYRRRITNRRRSKGECLHCRYHLRPT